MNWHWKLIACFALVSVAILGRGGACVAATSPVAPEQTVRAGPIEVTLKLDRSSMNVAESLVATLTVKAASGVRFSLPPAESKLGGFSVVSAADEPLRTIPTSSGDEQLLVRRYTLEPFLPGEYKFPPFEVRWQKSATESGVARTAEVKVNVETLLPKEADAAGKSLDPGTIRGAYTPPVEPNAGTMWTGIAIGFGCAAVVGLGFWGLSRRRQADDEVAHMLRRVQELRRSAPAGGVGPDALHELAGALRGALANRLFPSALTAESSELVGRLAKTDGWGDLAARQVGGILGALDAARFGGKSMPALEFGEHAETVAGVLTKLRAMPVPTGVKR